MRTALAVLLLSLITVAVVVKTWKGDEPAGDDPGTSYSVVKDDRGAGGAGDAGSASGDAGEATEATEATDVDPGALAGDLAEGRRLLAEAEAAGDRETATMARHRARIAFSRAMANGLAGPSADAVKKDLARLFDQTIRLDREIPGVTFRHRVASGERLWNLCVKADAPFRKRGAELEPGFVLWVNGLASARGLRAGASLTVPVGSFRLVVDKSRYSLRVFYGDGFVREYRVGLGREDRTPEGEFVVETKLKKPAWTSPDGKIYAYGDASNPLGTRWLGFKDSPRAAGYGIHGTGDPASIGGNASNGCVRMLNADVEELFSWVPRGTRVVIRR